MPTESRLYRLLSKAVPARSEVVGPTSAHNDSEALGRPRRAAPRGALFVLDGWFWRISCSENLALSIALYGCRQPN